MKNFNCVLCKPILKVNLCGGSSKEQTLNFIEIIELVILLIVLLKSDSHISKQKKRTALRMKNSAELSEVRMSTTNLVVLDSILNQESTNVLLKASNENIFSLWATKFPLQFCRCGAKETIDNTGQKSIPTKFYLQNMSNSRAQCLLVPDLNTI